MKSNRKALLLTLCAILLVVGTVVGSLAYFTDSEVVTNTFTVGNVAIELHEDGEVTRKDGTVGKDYHLLPGHSYSKDPTVTVTSTTDDAAYVRMIVTVSDYADLKAAFPAQEYYDADGNFLLQKLVSGWDASKWECVNISENGVYEFRYFETATRKSGPKANGKLESLFTEIVIPGTVTNDQLEKLEDMVVSVEAHAIQAAGFETDENGAWLAFDGQNS